jgi:hypothetical protein
VRRSRPLTRMRGALGGMIGPGGSHEPTAGQGCAHHGGGPRDRPGDRDALRRRGRERDPQRPARKRCREGRCAARRSGARRGRERFRGRARHVRDAGAALRTARCAGEQRRDRRPRERPVAAAPVPRQAAQAGGRARGDWHDHDPPRCDRGADRRSLAPAAERAPRRHVLLHARGAQAHESADVGRDPEHGLDHGHGRRSGRGRVLRARLRASWSRATSA